MRNDNSIGEVMLNENAMNGMRINGDAQLQQLVDKLDPSNSNHQLLHQFLQPQINPSIDHAAEYEKRESQDIYHAYEKAVVSFANRHTTLNPRRVNHHAFFSQFSYEGVFSHGKVSVDAFVAESVPPLNQILEERGLKEYSPEKVNDLCDRLRERNIDLTEDFFQNHIVVEGPSNSSKAQ